MSPAAKRKRKKIHTFLLVGQGGLGTEEKPFGTVSVCMCFCVSVKLPVPNELHALTYISIYIYTYICMYIHDGGLTHFSFFLSFLLLSFPLPLIRENFLPA